MLRCVVTSFFVFVSYRSCVLSCKVLSHRRIVVLRKVVASFSLSCRIFLVSCVAKCCWRREGNGTGNEKGNEQNEQGNEKGNGPFAHHIALTTHRLTSHHTLTTHPTHHATHTPKLSAICSLATYHSTNHASYIGSYIMAHTSCIMHKPHHTYYIKVTWLQHCIRQHITHHGTVHAPYHDHPTVCHRAPHIKAPCTTNHARFIPMCK